MSPRRLRSLTPTSLNAIDHRYWFASRNRNTALNSNSHSIGHLYSDGHRYANGSADRH
jgi:hypothetical protein